MAENPDATLFVRELVPYGHAAVFGPKRLDLLVL